LVSAKVPFQPTGEQNIRGDETNLISQAQFRPRLDGNAILTIASPTPISASIAIDQGQAGGERIGIFRAFFAGLVFATEEMDP
jgi:hypothetical protein